MVKFSFLFLLLSPTFLLAGQAPNFPTPEGRRALIGFGYHFNEPDGNPVDISTKSNNGAINGTGNAVVTGIWANAISFNGNGGVTIPNNQSMKVKNFTLSCWIYVDSFPLSGNRAAVFTHNQGGCCNYGLSLLNFGVESNISFDANSQVLSVSYISTSTWTHVALIRRNNWRTEMWINGVLESSVAVTDQLMDVPIDPFTIGCANNCTVNFFSGRVEDAFFYQVDLSPGEIVNLAKGRNHVHSRSDSGGY